MARTVETIAISQEFTISRRELMLGKFDSIKGPFSMHYSAPYECGLSKAAVDSFASQVATHFGYRPGTSLTPIVEKMGGTIHIQNVLDFNRIPSGSIRVEGPARFEIFLAAHTGPARDRFTIAHELGHYVLHYLYARQNGAQIERLEAQRYGSGRVEWEANWFAAGFLMPTEQFAERYRALKGVIPLLADEFGVSVDAARIRAEFVGVR
ncbi:ImmA/IrrE family metallo-endopeptidase [Bradyrhizobium huanghuaihaiense]|uniref:ImmA/IrrE family metallo-endopeptidase n=1 Tax=Bradyrhizobium huanghuaihaiense TaxID=990078 RepID=UPI0021AA611C|nr:ImmA/IrrE family metallo-endopeptidase [Bradyrhizobium sp. CB3035]UWU76471.1 ImmA/IrrE family metallo-endopeptidase [Bradyrhizobium sp. CB3035]